MKKNIVNIFFDNCLDEKFKKYKNGCMRMAYGFISKNKDMITTKDEVEDLMQDVLLAFIEATQEYKEERGSFYALYKYKLKSLKQTFVGKYLGIGMTYQDYMVCKDNLILQKTQLEEEWLDSVSYEILGGGSLYDDKNIKI